MKYKDYYATLDVPRDASLDQIKKAYRKLARQYHPDVSKDTDAEARFKDAAEAYATLKHPDKRAAYDALARQVPGEEFSPPPQWQRDFDRGAPSFEDMDLEDFLASMGRGHAGERHTPMPIQGRDLEHTVHIGLMDAHRGTTLHLDVADLAGTRTLEVKIPVGVTEGQKIRLRGMGGVGRHGGVQGDIYLEIVFKPHPLWRCAHHDLYYDLTLAPWESALGAEVDVTTPDGPLVLTVPPGTQSGSKLRMKGRGLATPTGGRGDLYAVIGINVSTTLTQRERELFQELAQVSTYRPRNPITKETNP